MKLKEDKDTEIKKFIEVCGCIYGSAVDIHVRQFRSIIFDQNIFVVHQ